MMLLAPRQNVTYKSGCYSTFLEVIITNEIISSVIINFLVPQACLYSGPGYQDYQSLNHKKEK